MATSWKEIEMDCVSVVVSKLELEPKISGTYGAFLFISFHYILCSCCFSEAVKYPKLSKSEKMGESSTHFQFNSNSSLKEPLVLVLSCFPSRLALVPCQLELESCGIGNRQDPHFVLELTLHFHVSPSGFNRSALTWLGFLFRFARPTFAC